MGIFSLNLKVSSTKRDILPLFHILCLDLRTKNKEQSFWPSAKKTFLRRNYPNFHSITHGVQKIFKPSEKLQSHIMTQVLYKK